MLAWRIILSFIETFGALPSWHVSVVLRLSGSILVETTCALSTSLRSFGRAHDTGLQLLVPDRSYTVYDGCAVNENRREESADSQTTNPSPASARATTSNEECVPSMSSTGPRALVPSHLSCSGGTVGEFVGPLFGGKVGSVVGTSEMFDRVGAGVSGAGARVGDVGAEVGSAGAGVAGIRPGLGDVGAVVR